MKKIYFRSLKLIKGLGFLLCAMPFYLLFFMTISFSKEEEFEISTQGE